MTARRKRRQPVGISDIDLAELKASLKQHRYSVGVRTVELLIARIEAAEALLTAIALAEPDEARK